MNLGKSSLIANALAVNGVTTVWTNTYRMGPSSNFSVQVKCATSGAPSIRIQLEGSFYDPSSNTQIFTQGQSSVLYVVPDAMPDIISNIVDTNYHIKGFTPPFVVYGRYKITGLSGNPSDTTVTIYNMAQELARTLG